MIVMSERAGISYDFVSAASRPVEVLLAEDSDMDREIIAKRLLENNIVVYSAATRNDAIRLARSRDFDLAIIDMHLPWDGNGIAVMRAVREHNPMVPICAYSGQPEPDHIAKICAEVGVVAMADKNALERDGNYIRQLFTLCGLSRRAGME